MTKSPAIIRSHLVSFFIREMAGNTAAYNGKSVKSVKIWNTSSLGRILHIYNLLDNKPKNKVSSYILFLSVDKKAPINAFKGFIYVEQYGVKSNLQLSENSNRDVNNFLEDIFRVSFVNFVDGYKNGDNLIVDAINCWIEKYDLLEHGYSYETLRMLYYREKKKDSNLSRMQFKIGNRILNY